MNKGVLAPPKSKKLYANSVHILNFVVFIVKPQNIEMSVHTHATVKLEVAPLSLPLAVHLTPRLLIQARDMELIRTPPHKHDLSAVRTHHRVETIRWDFG